MTNEKAIEVIRGNCYLFNPLNLDRTTLVNTALDTAIKALEGADIEGYSSRLWKAAYERGKAEQTSVLGKIRAEIVHLHDWAFSREEILRIIDKYKAESEDKT